MTALTLIPLKPDSSGSVVYKPFSESDDFDEAWWNESIYGFEPSQHFYSVFVGQHEVARMEVEIQDVLNEDYPRPPAPRPYAVIHFFEVSEDHRRRGFGTDAVQLIASRYAGTPMVAFSEGADEFWGSLGWARFEHGSEPDVFRPMFMSEPR